MSPRAVRIVMAGLVTLVVLGLLGLIAFVFFLDAAMKDAFAALPLAIA